MALASASVWLWLGVVACLAAVATRRVWPLVSATLLVLGVVSYVGGAGPVPAAVLPAALCAYTLVRRAPAWVSVVTVLGVAVGFWAMAWQDPLLGLDDERTWAMVATALAWVIAPVLIGLVIASRRTAITQRRADELNRVAYAERLAMARDVHDVVGHSLSLIALQSGIALRVLDADPGQARRSLEAIRSASTTSLDELRRTLSVVRGEAALSPTPGLDDIAGLVEAVRTTGRPVVLHDRAPRRVPRAVQLVVHRVVQEALTNAVRHAPDRPIEVSIDVIGTDLAVQIRNGGEPTTIIEGNGLRGMRERVDSIQGQLSVNALAEGGVLVQARLPMGDGGEP